MRKLVVLFVAFSFVAVIISGCGFAGGGGGGSLSALSVSTITESAITGTSVTLNWTAASEVNGSNNLTYSLYRSSANPSYNSFATLAEVQAGTLVTSGIGLTSYTVSNLSSGSSYYFNVVVSDNHGNSFVYSPLGEYLDSTLSLFYPFKGDTNDISPNANDGIAVNSPTLVADRFGNPNGAYSFANASDNSFTGSSQYIYSTNNLNIGTSPVTLSFWYLAAGNGHANTGDRIVNLGADVTHEIFGLYPNSGTLYVWVNGPDLNTGVSVSTSSWQHWVLTLDGSDVMAYCNGSAALGPTADTNNLGNNPLYIAAPPDHSSAASGTLSDIRVYSSALSSGAVTKLYTVTRP